ncbi:hypothetical protein EJB05_54686, partial [Eragrostis curvula]
DMFSTKPKRFASLHLHLLETKTNFKPFETSPYVKIDMCYISLALFLVVHRKKGELYLRAIVVVKPTQGTLGSATVWPLIHCLHFVYIDKVGPANQNLLPQQLAASPAYSDSDSVLETNHAAPLLPFDLATRRPYVPPRSRPRRSEASSPAAATACLIRTRPPPPRLWPHSAAATATASSVVDALRRRVHLVRGLNPPLRPRLRRPLARGGMGAAASRLRSTAPAVKALAVAVLLLGAGAVGALHQNRASLPIESWTCSIHHRKALCVEPASTNRRRRPRPSLPMPRGVVQHNTNLEMEASLAGNPERRKQQEESKPTKKSLLAVAVGIKNKDTVNRLVSKFSADHFVIMLFHYDNTLEQWDDLEWSKRAVHVAAKGQTKWWFAKRFLHPDVVAEYEYIFVWDEDIEVETFDPLRYLDTVKREGFEVSQPALDRRSEIHHAITARALMPTSDMHRRAQGVRCDEDSMGPPCMGWVEFMVPVFSQEAWRCVWHMVQSDLVHGWGLDYKVGYCAKGDRAHNVGVVDSEYVLHRGIPMLSDNSKGPSSTGRAAVRWRSFKEMQIFNKRWEEASMEDESWTDPYAAAPLTASSI